MTSAEQSKLVGAKSKIATLILSCVLAVTASLATWGILHFKHRFYTVSSDFDIGMGASNEARLALEAETARIDRYNAAIALSIGGIWLAIAASIVSNSSAALPVKILVAVPWGAACGAGAGALGSIAFNRLMKDESLTSAATSGIWQAAVFALLGLGMALLHTWFERAWKNLARSALLGAFAGCLGGIAFPVITGIILPSHSTSTFISDVSIVRLFWLLVPFTCVGLSLALMSNNGKQTS